VRILLVLINSRVVWFSKDILVFQAIKYHDQGGPIYQRFLSICH